MADPKEPMARGCRHDSSTLCKLAFVLLVSVTLTRAQNSDRIRDLIGQLANDDTAWSASVGLQKLNDQAIERLIANLKIDPPVGEWHYSRTLATLEKMGPRAISLVTAAFLADQHEPDEPRQRYEERVRDKCVLIEVLGALGPDAIPNLIRVADAGPRLYHDYAFRAILGPAQTLLLGPGPSSGPWQQIAPMTDEIRQREKAVQPFLPRICALLREDRKHGQPQGVRPELPAAFILALWGSGEVKHAGIQVLRQLASTDEPFCFHDEPIRILALLEGKSAAELLKANLPPSGYELRDQLLVFTAQWLFRLGDAAYFETILPAFRSKDLEARQEAVRFAEGSHDLRFVPVLIPELGDSTPNGVRTYGEDAHEEAMADRALAALRHLTFQPLPRDSAAWEGWWSHNGKTTWRQLLTTYLARCMAEFDHTPYWELNSWMSQLEGAYDPAVLPLLGRFIRHPQLDVHATGPHQWMGSGGSTNSSFPWGPAPTMVTLLLGIAEQGNREAARLLHVCVASHDLDVRIYGSLALTGASRRTAINALRLEATRKESADTAIEALLKLGDSRGIGILIENLAHNQEPEQEWRRKRDYELLLRYTQEDIGYDPQGEPAQQDEGVRAWRKWWKQQSPDFKPRCDAATIDDRFRLSPARAYGSSHVDRRPHGPISEAAPQNHLVLPA